MKPRYYNVAGNIVKVLISKHSHSYRAHIHKNDELLFESEGFNSSRDAEMAAINHIRNRYNKWSIKVSDAHDYNSQALANRLKGRALSTHNPIIKLGMEGVEWL